MKPKGFTLIELLVVISVIGLLASVILVAVNKTRSRARDAQRRANLNQTAKALELYYNDFNSYPTTAGIWSGECSIGGGITPTSTNSIIPGLVPNYVSSLPHDPLTNVANPNTGVCPNSTYSCYLYRSNGTDYKLLAHCLPENNVSSDSLSDPVRPSWAWEVSSPGGSSW